MKYGLYPLSPERIDEQDTLVQTGQNEIVHVGVVIAMGGYNRAANRALVFILLEAVMIGIPKVKATAGDGVGLFHLRPQKGRNEFTRKIG